MQKRKKLMTAIGLMAMALMVFVALTGDAEPQR
jgi:hypothetical protein